MIGIAKRAVRWMFNRAGYVILKRSNYEKLGAATPLMANSEKLPETSLPIKKNSAGEGREPIEPSASQWSLAERELGSERMRALHSAVTHLVKSDIKGDIVDCGAGATATLGALAISFVQLGDTSRRLVLFDTSADPTHRAETKLELWGTDRDPFRAADGAPGHAKSEPPPSELLATGYPAGKFIVKRYPRDEIRGLGPLAFLGLTSEAYPSNVDAIEAFVPHLERGGVMAVETSSFKAGARDAVDEFLRKEGLAVPLERVSEHYRLGIRP
jgi:hypothetical protein